MIYLFFLPPTALINSVYCLLPLKFPLYLLIHKPLNNGLNLHVTSRLSFYLR